MGAAFNILTVNVAQKSQRQTRCWDRCPPSRERYDASNVPNFATPGPFTLDMQR